VSIKSKVLSAAAALALAGSCAAAGVLAAGNAGAATPSCGGWPCVDVFSHEFGTYHHANYVMDVFRQGEKVGQPVILYRTSNSDPAEDFTVSFQGLVSDFYAAGMVSAAVDLHYGGGSVGSQDETAWELEYAPFGVDSGLCVGVQSTAFQHEKVTLQPCGVSSKTVWIWDTYDQGNLLQVFLDGFTFPAINGSDTNFSHPFVLSYPSNGFPTDKPRPQLEVTNLTGFSNGFGPIVGSIPDRQLWGARVGVLP
jgi:hypothetical protein